MNKKNHLNQPEYEVKKVSFQFIFKNYVNVSKPSKSSLIFEAPHYRPFEMIDTTLQRLF